MDMNFLKQSFGHYRTTIFGLIVAVCTYLVANHVGPAGVEQTIASIATLLLGATAADASGPGSGK
jgi:hypothetical protein